jgi:hypothetical protein
VNHPAGWRVDEPGRINPNVAHEGDGSLAAGRERAFRSRLLVYRCPARAEALARAFLIGSKSADVGWNQIWENPG